MSKAYLKTYFTVLLSIFFLVGVINLTVDPLWYLSGNHLTGVNLPWNERIMKTNLLLQEPKDQYDCLLFGTSRSTLFDTALLTNHQCFNYAFSAGDPEEFVNYAEYAKAEGVNPVQVYVEIDPKDLRERRGAKHYAEVNDPLPVYQAYLFSFDVLRLSIDTLIADDAFKRVYDRHFRGRVDEDAPDYKPEFEPEEQKSCDLSRIRPFEALKQTFPDAKIVGFVAPLSAWYVYNTRYSPGLLDCQLEGIYQISQRFDAVYDFSVPSPTTIRTDNTYDGHHYYPSVYETVAAVLEKRRSDFGMHVNEYSLTHYREQYLTKLQNFLQQAGEGERWRG
ncbi:hypothetical protein C7B61_14870 [filamentous cyanobacterium CCP1]|nr:hypothetical protein C7B61_14870 [filamentous cyanobacterium CCP1]